MNNLYNYIDRNYIETVPPDRTRKDLHFLVRNPNGGTGMGASAIKILN